MTGRASRASALQAPVVEAGDEWWFVFVGDERREVGEKPFEPSANNRGLCGVYQLVDGEGYIVLPGR